jgi:hypothetical protein
MRPDEDPKGLDFMVNEDANGSPWVMAVKNARFSMVTRPRVG